MSSSSSTASSSDASLQPLYEAATSTSSTAADDDVNAIYTQRASADDVMQPGARRNSDSSMLNMVDFTSSSSYWDSLTQSPATADVDERSVKNILKFAF